MVLDDLVCTGSSIPLGLATSLPSSAIDTIDNLTCTGPQGSSYIVVCNVEHYIEVRSDTLQQPAGTIKMLVVSYSF